MSELYDDVTRRTEDTAEYAGRQAGDATEYAGRQAKGVTERVGGDATERVGREIEDSAGRLGNRMRSARSGLPFNDVDVDVTDRGDELAVMADLPGFSKSDIDATLSGQTLRIVAEREESEKDESYFRRERRRSSVQRSVALPDSVADEDATAEYKNGVLTVTIPKIVGRMSVGEDTPTTPVESHDFEPVEDTADATEDVLEDTADATEDIVDTAEDATENVVEETADATEDIVDTAEDESVDSTDSEPSIAAAVEGSVAELEDALATGDYDDRLDAVEDAERESQDRTTAYEAIDDRREDT